MTEKTTILLVDDNRKNLTELAETLKSDDYQLLLANCGKEAIKYTLEEKDIAFIILNVEMSGMDGFETAAAIEQGKKLRQIPFIFISAAFLDDASILRGYSSGAFDYITKPLVPEILRSKVATFVRLHELSKEMRLALEKQSKQQTAIELERERGAQLQENIIRLTEIARQLRLQLDQEVLKKEQHFNRSLKSLDLYENAVDRNNALLKRISKLSEELLQRIRTQGALQLDNLALRREIERLKKVLGLYP